MCSILSAGFPQFSTILRELKLARGQNGDRTPAPSSERHAVASGSSGASRDTTLCRSSSDSNASLSAAVNVLSEV
eukprot:1105491-Prymnesium_polylepis.1